ncbi:MAG: phage/plasmid primase, P4 family, partial [Pseudomonadota bacterium]
LQALLGENATALSFKTLAESLSTGGSGPSPDIARLRGKRLAVATEPGRNARFDEGFVKSLSGGDRILARGMRQDLFEFVNRAQIVVSMNDPPNVSDDAGVARRLLYVPFLVSIPRGERDPRLRDRIIANELPGVLNWAIAGAVEFDEVGLDPPETVLEHTRKNLAAADSIGDWAERFCEFGPDKGPTPIGDLRASYEKYCAINALDPVSPNRFSRWLSRKGCENGHGRITGKRSVARYRSGVGLLANASPETMQAASEAERSGDQAVEFAGDEESEAPF